MYPKKKNRMTSGLMLHDRYTVIEQKKINRSIRKQTN